MQKMIPVTSAISLTAATIIAVAAMALSSGASSAATAPNGQALYAANCASCHKADGTGAAGTFPALAGNPHVTAKNPSAIIGVTKAGGGMMPAYKAQLSNAQIAALMTYIRASWGNKAAAVTEKQVAGAN